MLWSEKDSLNLKRIADALEIMSGRKTFVPSNEKMKIDVVETEESEEDVNEREKKEDKIRTILEENEGKHVWEETNLEEIAEELNE